MCIIDTAYYGKELFCAYGIKNAQPNKNETKYDAENNDVCDKNDGIAFAHKIAQYLCNIYAIFMQYLQIIQQLR